MTETPPAGPERPQFRRRHRFDRATDFRQAYCQGRRKSSGPLTAFVRPTTEGEHRLGLSVGRRVGNAIARNRLKRLLREAFRLSRTSLPTPSDGHYDVLVTVRPHPPMPLDAYQRLLVELVARAHRDLATPSRPDRQLPPASPTPEHGDAP